MLEDYSALSIFSLGRFDNGLKIFSHQTGSADQGPVEVGLRQQFPGIVGLDRTAILYPQSLRYARSKPLRQQAANKGVRFLRLGGVAVNPVPMAHTGS